MVICKDFKNNLLFNKVFIGGSIFLHHSVFQVFGKSLLTEVKQKSTSAPGTTSLWKTVFDKKAISLIN